MIHMHWVWLIQCTIIDSSMILIDSSQLYNCCLASYKSIGKWNLHVEKEPNGDVFRNRNEMKVLKNIFLVKSVLL